ncbi:hypothetical protein NPIL_391701 [Nephila pilipes]|uniref:Uncharacterized protein n=1 Tax=Nephila pilipes TaxID=299642 RepID=A0A8X6QU56_NEPPI|nr:hypothetical protein NPIL_391701 [Nephila pilipes]
MNSVIFLCAFTSFVSDCWKLPPWIRLEASPLSSLRSSPEKRILDSTTVQKPLSFGVSRRAESPFRSRPSFSALLNPLRLCSVEFSSTCCVKIAECFLKF